MEDVVDLWKVNIRLVDSDDEGGCSPVLTATRALCDQCGGNSAASELWVNHQVDDLWKSTGFLDGGIDNDNDRGD